MDVLKNKPNFFMIKKLMAFLDYHQKEIQISFNKYLKSIPLLMGKNKFFHFALQPMEVWWLLGVSTKIYILISFHQILPFLITIRQIYTVCKGLAKSCLDRTSSHLWWIGLEGAMGFLLTQGLHFHICLQLNTMTYSWSSIPHVWLVKFVLLSEGKIQFVIDFHSNRISYCKNKLTFYFQNFRLMLTIRNWNGLQVSICWWDNYKKMKYV